MIWQEMSNIFPKEESTGSLTARHWEDKFLCTIWNIKWFKFHHVCILYSKIFPTSTHTPKYELKRRSYSPDKLEKKNKLLSRNYRGQASCHNQETVSRPKNCVATKKLGRYQKNCVATKDQNIGKYRYIGNWILWKYRKISVDIFTKISVRLKFFIF